MNDIRFKWNYVETSKLEGWESTIMIIWELTTIMIIMLYYVVELIGNQIRYSFGTFDRSWLDASKLFLKSIHFYNDQYISKFLIFTMCSNISRYWIKFIFYIIQHNLNYVLDIMIHFETFYSLNFTILL